MTLADHLIGAVCMLLAFFAVLAMLCVLALPMAILYQLLRW